MPEYFDEVTLLNVRRIASGPDGRSLYIDTVTLGLTARLSSVSPSSMTWRSAGLSVLTSVMPARRPTTAIAVCQSSMTPTCPAYAGSHSAS